MVCIDSHCVLGLDSRKKSVLTSLFNLLPRDSSHVSCCPIEHLTYYVISPDFRLLQGQRLLKLGIKARAPVQEAYRWLCQSYRAGDYIYLFGVKRGAREVRRLIHMIKKIGLIYQENEHLSELAYEIFVDRDRGRAGHNAALAAKFKKTFSRSDVRIHFFGTWESISVMNMKDLWSLEESRLGHVLAQYSVDFCCRAISVDERWLEFSPQQRAENWPEKQRSEIENQNIPSIKIAVFPEASRNVVESMFLNRRDSESSSSLRWMISQAKMAGLRIRSPPFSPEYFRLFLLRERHQSLVSRAFMSIFMRYKGPQGSENDGFTNLSRHLSAHVWCKVDKTSPQVFRSNDFETWPYYGIINHANNTLYFGAIETPDIRWMISELSRTSELHNDADVAKASETTGPINSEILRILSTTELGVQVMSDEKSFKDIQRLVEIHGLPPAARIDMVGILALLLHKFCIQEQRSTGTIPSTLPESLGILENAIISLLQIKDQVLLLRALKILQFILLSPWLRDHIDFSPMKHKIEEIMSSQIWYEASATPSIIKIAESLLITLEMEESLRLPAPNSDQHPTVQELASPQWIFALVRWYFDPAAVLDNRLASDEHLLAILEIITHPERGILSYSSDHGPLDNILAVGALALTILDKRSQLTDNEALSKALLSMLPKGLGTLRQLYNSEPILSNHTQVHAFLLTTLKILCDLLRSFASFQSTEDKMITREELYFLDEPLQQPIEPKTKHILPALQEAKSLLQQCIGYYSKTPHDVEAKAKASSRTHSHLQGPLRTAYPESILLAKGVQSLDVKLWIDMLHHRASYTSAGIINKVEHYKCTNGIQHEFLAVHLKHPASVPSRRPDDQQFVLFIERTVPPNAMTMLSSSSPPLSIPVPASDILSIPSPRIKDPIVSLYEEHEKLILLSSVEFSPESPPTDKDLADILDFATTLHPQYDLRYHGYWYAGLIFDALQGQFRGQKKNTENADKRGHFEPFKAPVGEGWTELKFEFEKWKSRNESNEGSSKLS